MPATGRNDPAGEMREEIRALCPDAFVRPANVKDALFVTDFCRRAAPEARDAARQALAARGYSVSAERELWFLTPGSGRIRKIPCGLSAPVPETPPRDAALQNLWHLARILRRQAEDTEADPVFCLALLRALASPLPAEQAASVLPAAFADALREGRKCKTKLTAYLAESLYARCSASSAGRDRLRQAPAEE